MFKFLKEKLKGAVSQFSKNIEEEGKEEVKESPVEEIVEESQKEDKIEKVKKEGTQSKTDSSLDRAEESIKEKLKKKQVPSIQELAERKQENVEEPKKNVDVSKEEKEEPEEDTEEKKGIFSSIKEKISTKKINQKQFEEMFWNLEVVLLENNVAVEVIEKIKEDLKVNLVDQPIKRGQVINTISNSLKDTIINLFEVVEDFNFIDKIKEKKPFVISFVGINGSGKTTTIAKVVKLLQKNNLSCILAAADTFRAAAIDQLQTHADKLNVKMIKHDYGADPAAVAFDAVKHAESKGIDVVLIDTAGRMHSNINLMEEIEKLIRVAKPDLKIFVGESITGNDCTEQAKKFNETIGIDGIILSKADIDEKGGAAISVSYVTGKPILFIGTGQEYDNLEKFDPSLILKSLGL